MDNLYIDSLISIFMALQGKVLIDYILQAQQSFFDSFTALEKECPDCHCRIYEARLMSGDEDEAGSWRDYHFCNCPGVLVVRDEIRADRVTPCRIPIDEEYHLRRFFSQVSIAA